jgi:hypothetical protein
MNFSIACVCFFSLILFLMPTNSSLSWQYFEYNPMKI